MKPAILILFTLTLFFQACGQAENSNQTKPGNQVEHPVETKQKDFINESGTSIESRFLLPDDFERVDVQPGSFAEYLRKLPLKPHGSKVKYYDGTVKNNYGVYDAVVDMDIGTRDLQQCADAIMRLRGEFLFQQKQYHKIHFNFTNGFRVDYSKWAGGFRVIVKGNKSNWKRSAPPANTYNDFRNYMDAIFMYAGTLSLSKELDSVDYKDLKIGDIFIQGGSPGHAVIVVDLAIHMKTGDKIYLLAQSYMPAQETQLLKNPMDRDLSPWYQLDLNDKTIETPEWEFKTKDLKRFE